MLVAGVFRSYGAIHEKRQKNHKPRAPLELQQLEPYGLGARLGAGLGAGLAIGLPYLIFTIFTLPVR